MMIITNVITVGTYMFLHAVAYYAVGLLVVELQSQTNNNKTITTRNHQTYIRTANKQTNTKKTLKNNGQELQSPWPAFGCALILCSLVWLLIRLDVFFYLLICDPMRSNGFFRRCPWIRDISYREPFGEKQQRIRLDVFFRNRKRVVVAAVLVMGPMLAMVAATLLLNSPYVVLVNVHFVVVPVIFLLHIGLHAMLCYDPMLRCDMI